ncbi:MAG: serine racemase VanT catalytic subunit [Roseburia sp.]
MREKSRAWIELDRERLAHNVMVFRGMLPKGCRLMPAVKANAYGHGAVPVAHTLQELGIRDFCVASLAEGIQLREAGIEGQILILGYTDPARAAELLHYHMTQAVVDAAYGQELDAACAKVVDAEERLAVHVAVDTGMRRLGIPWEQRNEICNIWEYRNLCVTGIFSHLCVSDGTGESEVAFTREQIARFDEVAAFLHGSGKKEFTTHLQGSYGVLNYPECQYDYARVGIALYGVPSSEAESKTGAFAGLLPVLSLKARVESVRDIRKGEGAGYGLDFVAEQDGRIAAVAIGYADGIPRSLSGKGFVCCRGKRVPIAGRICMDQLLIDVTELPEVMPGDEAVLIGENFGEEIRAEQFADWAGTISNEILSRLGERLERVMA